MGTITPDRTAEGTFLEFMPQARYTKANTTRLNPYGGGPFCRFLIPNAPHLDGVYGLTADDNVIYIGEAQDLARRWGLSQYGSIQPKNCYVGGQSTNCNINARVLRSTKAGKRLDLFFLETEGSAIQDWLIGHLHPLWNGRCGFWSDRLPSFTSRQPYTTSIGVYENPGMGVRNRPERVYAISRNPQVLWRCERVVSGVEHEVTFEATPWRVPPVRLEWCCGAGSLS